MRASVFFQPSPIEYASDTQWGINEALIAELQRCGAANVDKGFQQLLQTLLGVTNAQSVCCQLIECNKQLEQIVIMSMTAGLHAVSNERHGITSVVVLNHEIRPGRQLQFKFTSIGPGYPIHVDAASFLLCTQHRWLAWLDLSYGPVAVQGVLSPLHRRVLFLLLKGLSEKQLASELGLNVNTTHLYVKQLYRRYGVRNRASLMSLWLNPAQAEGNAGE